MADAQTIDKFLSIIPEVKGKYRREERKYEEQPDTTNYRLVYKAGTLDGVLEILGRYFGEPLTPSGKRTPWRLRKHKVIVATGGIRKEQTLYVRDVEEGLTQYAAIWPWASDDKYYTLHVGFLFDDPSTRAAVDERFQATVKEEGDK